MIGRLCGSVVARDAGTLIIDVGGVGYEVLVTTTTEYAAALCVGELTLFVHTHVKEDALTLYGFARGEERDAFRLLLGVSNVGPRTALALLSGLTVGELADAVAKNDLLRLSKVQGIGKKTAERLVFELQDKLKLFSIPTGDGSPGRSHSHAPGARDDLLSALGNLGYKPAQQDRALAAVSGLLEAKAPFEEVLREALRTLAR